MRRCCYVCGETDLSKFGPCKDRGLKYICRYCENERMKKWLRDHPEVNRARVRAYRTKNPDRIRQKERQYAKKRRSSSRGLLDNRMKQAIASSARGYGRSKKWQSWVGYSINDLREHLKITIPSGYQWQDFLSGHLQIDHRLPICSFSYNNPKDEEFKKCWSLNNLRVLPPFENGSKGRRIIF